MKRRLLRALACALLAAVIALPGALALEKANTQKELTYGGIEWYIDYGALADTLAGTALDSGSIDREDNFGSGSFYAPDWISVLTGTTYISDGDKDCGGSLKLDTHRAKLSVAKHELLEAEFYFMWNPETGAVEDYTAEGATQYYMVRLLLKNGWSNSEQHFKDFVSDLRGSYGFDVYSEVGGAFHNVEYDYWVDPDGAVMGVSNNGGGITMAIMAPGAGDKLAKIKKLVR